MFDEQLALITSPDQISYSKLTAGLNKVLETIGTDSQGDLEQLTQIVGALIGSQLVLLKKLELTHET